MRLPTIQLIEALCEASNALDAAYSALKETAPNGRDYYPQGPDAITQAEKEYRLRRLDSVKDEIDKLTVAIDEIHDWNYGSVSVWGRDL